MTAFGLVLAALIGVSLGMLGGGGSILTVPILVYVVGFEAKPAIAMSLAVVGAASLLGAVRHWRDGNVNLRVALIFGIVAMAGTYLGARVSVFFSGEAQLTIFAVVMLAAAVFMFRDRTPAAVPAAPAESRMQLAGIGLAAIAVGMLTGIVGVGGGFLIVPVLVLVGRISMKEAVGTSLLVIALNSAVGFYAYLGTVEVPWRFLSLFTAIAMAGILVGTQLVRSVSAASLKRTFSVFLVFMALFILYQNRGVFMLRDDAARANAPSPLKR